MQGRSEIVDRVPGHANRAWPQSATLLLACVPAWLVSRRLRPRFTRRLPPPDSRDSTFERARFFARVLAPKRSFAIWNAAKANDTGPACPRRVGEIKGYLPA